MKIRDGYEILFKDGDIPYVFFRGEVIALIQWYPLHPTENVGYIFDKVIWHPNATPRNKLEAPVYFAKNCGTKLMGWSRKHDMKFFKLLERAGCVKHTGYSDMVFYDQRAKTWESVQ